MGVYVDNQLEYVVNGSTLDTNVSMSSGGHHTVVEEWDYCGGASYTPVDITVTNQSGVTVTAPANGGSSGSPVNYVATATTTCGQGVASMGIYVNNNLMYVVQGSKLNTSISFVSRHLQLSGRRMGPLRWRGLHIRKNYGHGRRRRRWWKYFQQPASERRVEGIRRISAELRHLLAVRPGRYLSSINQHISSPSLSGNSTKYSIGGTRPYADVLWTNPLIGTYSSQGMPDSDHKIIPNLHYFTYDIEFYGSSLQLPQDLEFDINQYFNGMGFTWGHQCNIGNGHQFDIWDNVHSHWIHTGVPCNPVNNGGNHLTLQVQRTSDNQLLIPFHHLQWQHQGPRLVLSALLSVGTGMASRSNYQEDGNSSQSPHSVRTVDRFNLTSSSRGWGAQVPLPCGGQLHRKIQLNTLLRTSSGEPA